MSIAADPGQDVAFVASTGYQPAAFERGRALLRQECALTIPQFRELDSLLQQLSPRQFALLTDDPQHQVRLREYEALSWRRYHRALARGTLLFFTCLAVAVGVMSVGGTGIIGR